MDDKSESKSFTRFDPYLSVLLKFLALVAVLGLCAILLQHKVTGLLNATLERTMIRQATEISLLVEERCRREFTELSFAANYLSQHPEAMDSILYQMSTEQEGVSAGFLRPGDESVRVSNISKWNFTRLPQSFRGNVIADYCPNRGLLFAVPVMHGDNVRAVLYRLYDESVLTGFFGLAEFDTAIRAIVTQRDGQVIVRPPDFAEKDRTLFEDEQIRSRLGELRENLLSSRAAAAHTECSLGEYFLFGANLTQADFIITGYVPWAVIANRVASIQLLILRVGSLGLFLLAAISAYLFFVREKAAESDALREAKITADRANQAKSLFLANMSHEIRTPINAILGMNEMILREEKNPQILRYAHNVAGAGKSLLSLINDILDFSKIESGKMEIVDVRYHMSSLLNDVINITRPRAENKGLEFRMEIDETIPEQLFGDVVRVQQILVNLLTNAAKYTKEGFIEFIVRCERAEKGVATFCFIIRDSGIGIKDEDKARMFRDFERFDIRQNRSIEGTGLGLAITHSLIEAMHGEIRLESVYGQGSTFTVLLPQAVLDMAPIGDFAARMEAGLREKAKYQAKHIAPEAEILIVDDNEMNLLVATSLLKQTQVKADTCMSGKACLEKLGERRYDMVFLDHMMPGMDGIETMHHARKLPNAQGTPFIILTANAVSGAREMFLKEGFNDYLSKPVEAELLEEALWRYLPPEKVKDAPPDMAAEDTTESADGNATATPAAALATESPAAEPASSPAGSAAPAGETAADGPLPVLDVQLGLRYCGNMEKVYWRLLPLFCRMREEKQKEIEDALAQENWKDYTTFVHALKSSSLSIGGQPCSEAAKALELAGKRYLDEEATEDDKKEALEYIRANHQACMALYDELAAAGEKTVQEHQANG